jgi:hypothetical protein
MIRGTELEWVPAISNTDSAAYDSSAPVYGLNFQTFEYVFKSGWDMVKRPPYQAANQGNVRVRVMNNTGQIICYDRRANFIGYVA